MSPRWLYWPAAAGGGTPWTPAELGLTLQCWLDGSQLSGSNGTPISVWTDASGNGLNGVQSGENRPTVATGALNGLNVVNFNGNQWFDHNSARDMLRNRSAGIAVVVIKYGVVNNSAWQFAWTNVATDITGMRLNFRHAANNQFRTALSRLDNQSPVEVGTNTMPPFNALWHLHAVEFRWTNGNFEYLIDGNPIGTGEYMGSGNTSDTAINSGPDAITAIGALRRSGSLSLSNGSQIAEMICAAKSSGIFSTIDRQRLEGYLAHKWGLEGDLPGGHPYKSAPPTV